MTQRLEPLMETIERGRGDRVVLVHGDLFDAEATWAAQEPLAESYRLVLANRRGFGNSTDIDGEDFDVDAQDVAHMLRAEPGHLAGHSYGGVVALLAAAQVPDSVRSLVVFEPPAFGLVADHPNVQRFIADIDAILAANPTPEDFVRQFIAAVGGDPSRLPTPLPPPMLKAARVQMRGRWPWNAEIPVDQLAGTAYPKLVISGGHSTLFDSVCDVLEARLPARREVVRGAGHSIPTLGKTVNGYLSAFWASAVS
jgi:pimeloyl-ACP methyl ester carboxylesterase